jgi:hypothetical protein
VSGRPPLEGTDHFRRDVANDELCHDAINAISGSPEVKGIT